MAQVRFYPTDLRRKSASHTLLMAQVPPLKTDLLHSSHPPAPLTLPTCTAYPTHLRHPLTLQACTTYPTHTGTTHPTELRRTALPGAITGHRTAPPHTTKCGGYYLTEPPPRRTRLGGLASAFLPETGLEHGPLLPKCRLLSYRGRSPSASPACLIPRTDVVLQKDAANVLLAEL